MNREQCETSVLELWVSTRIPLSRAHLQYHTGLSRQRLTRWLDELTDEGVMECDVDDAGEMLWSIPGAARSTAGPRTFAEFEQRGERGGGGPGPAGAGRQKGAANARRNGGERSGSRGKRAGDADDAMASIGRAALALARTGGGPPARKGDGDDGERHKSLALSAGLSFLGPAGWLYAGSLREAAVATALGLLVWKLAPAFLLMPILWLALPLSALVGLVYAWQYNRRGERTALFLDSKKDDDKDKDKDKD